MTWEHELLQAGVHPSWLPAFTNCAAELEQVLAAVARERTQALVLPPPGQVFRALRVDPALVRVILLGQDPYPTPGHPTGLAFSVAPEVTRLPPSLCNIFQELAADLDVPPPTVGDLTPWVRQGVLLLNTALTVQAGQAGSHAALGWRPVVCAVLEFLARRHQQGQPLVAVLWGKQAQQFGKHLPQVPTLVGVHPSPLSAHRGFFGSRPFSAVNKLLQQQGASPIVWNLASAGLF
ncbi:uracil-DNA glycosylase [Leucobacter sp. OH2974_COT-288]|nr:uracil-DNA glycosylase [Leucobacter sp. OH2974_COT-288]